MSIRGAKQNYDILFKSAVVRLKMDADVHNELLREWCRLRQLRFDDDANLILWEGQMAQVQELQDELKRYFDIIWKDTDEVEKYRELKEKEHETD